jgi:hypothetical protein
MRETPSKFRVHFRRVRRLDSVRIGDGRAALKSRMA